MIFYIREMRSMNAFHYFFQLFRIASENIRNRDLLLMTTC